MSKSIIAHELYMSGGGRDFDDGLERYSSGLVNGIAVGSS